MKLFLKCIFYVVLGLNFISCESDNSAAKRTVNSAGIKLENEFKLISYKCSGLTDYNIDIELQLNSTDTKKIIKLIESQNGFFLADSIVGQRFTLRANNDPYKRANNYHWHFYRPTKLSYEYYSIDVNELTNNFKLHYLDEE